MGTRRRREGSLVEVSWQLHGQVGVCRRPVRASVRLPGHSQALTRPQHWASARDVFKRGICSKHFMNFITFLSTLIPWEGVSISAAGKSWVTPYSLSRSLLPCFAFIALGLGCQVPLWLEYPGFSSPAFGPLGRFLSFRHLAAWNSIPSLYEPAHCVS